MTFSEAVGAQPQWLLFWFYWLAFALFLLPLALFLWRETRMAALANVAAMAFNALTVPWLYSQLGYVKLLGLPHIVVWVPLVWYLWQLIKHPHMPALPRRIMLVIAATLVGSLAFDVTDVVRYALGEQTPMAGTVP